MELTEAALTALAHRAKVPESLHDGLIAHILTGRRTGDFLRAILENDLYGACARADEDNRYRLYDVVFFLTNYAPSGCWRSPEAVATWRAHGGARALIGEPRP
jgi:hypothetical protein